METGVSRRGFLGALAALAAATQIPVALKAQADSILVALLKARSEDGYLFLVRKADWKQLWRMMQDHERYSADTGFCNILVRGVPVVYLDHADTLLGSRDYALIKQERFEKELEA